ncbi:MAG: IS200/IS605 family transposase [Candidatus Brocadiia bacterium]
MADTLTNLLYHVVFGTRERRRVLTPELRDDLFSYIGGIIRGEGGRLLEVGGTRDHVHLLVSFPPTVAVSDMMRKVKGNSSRRFSEYPCFAWQNGYAAFSVSESAADSVAQYIDRQEHHHRGMGFDEEFVRLLDRHGIDYDERYLWT